MSIFGQWFGSEQKGIFEEALAAFDREEFARAEALFEICVAQWPDAATLRLAKFYIAECAFHLASRAFESSEYGIAETKIRTALALQPAFPAFNLLAAKIAGQRTPQEVDGYLDRALETNPRFSAALAFRGAVWFSRGERKEGLAECKLACEVDPDLGVAHLDAAELNTRNENWELANEHLFALSSPVDASNFRRALGDARFSDQRWPEAVQEYQLAIAHTPHHPDLYCRLGQALEKQSHSAEAIAQYHRALAINPQNPEALFRLHSLLERQSKVSKKARETRPKVDQPCT